MDFEKTMSVHVDVEYVAEMLANRLEEIFTDYCGYDSAEIGIIDENKVLRAVAKHWLKNMF